MVNLKQMIEDLIFKFRGSCIYTWVNVNLNLSGISFLDLNFSFYWEVAITIAPSPLNHLPLTDKSVFDKKKNIITSAVPASVSGWN